MKCTGPECDRVVYHSEPPLCRSHYQQASRGEVLKPLKYKPFSKPLTMCKGPECVRQAAYRKLELCAAHKQQLDSTGILKPLRSAIARTRVDCKARNEDGHKQCTRCRKWLAESEFTRHSTTLDGLSRECRECQRDQMLQRKYKITLAEYDERLAKQGGHCATCPATERLHVDHDHACCPGDISCGKCVRGILCGECNAVLGYVQDSPAVLSNLVTYVTSRI